MFLVTSLNMKFHLYLCVTLLVMKGVCTARTTTRDGNTRDGNTRDGNSRDRGGDVRIKEQVDDIFASQDNVSVITRAEILLQKFAAFRNESDVCNSNMTSCSDACGEFRATTCSCDSSCQMYENCCEDYFDVCPKGKTIPHLTATCPSYVNVMLLSGCPTDVNTTASRRCLQSARTAIEDVVPVTLRGTYLFFKNGYCAECNGFVHFDYWSGTVAGYNGFRGLQTFIQDLKSEKVKVNWKTQPLYYLRPCFPSAHISSDMTSEDSDDISDLCNAFTSYVYSRSDDTYYRNRYCIQGIGNNSDISCEPVTKITTHFARNSEFTFQKGTEENEWQISGMSNRSDHVDTFMCYSNGTDASKIISCMDGYIIREGSCQKPRIKLTIKTTLSPSVFEAENPPFDTMTSFVSKLSLYQIQHMKAVGVNGSRCSLDIEKHSLIYNDDIAWRLTQQFLCRFDDDVLDKRQLFHVDLSVKISAAMKQAFSHATRDIQVHFTACLADEGSVSTIYDYCFESVANWTRSLTRPQSSYVESVISDICCTISVVGLFIRISLQPVIPFYRSAPGNIQFCLCVTLFLAYIVFLVGGLVVEGSVACTVLAALTHWGFLSALLWMNVIAFKMWQTFRSWQSQLNSQTTSTLSLSALFSMIPPLLTIILGLLMDHYIPDSAFSPNYGAHACWITKPSSMIVFFVIPSNTISIINSVLVYLALLGIWKERRAFREVTSANKKIDLELAVKVIVLVGVTWLVGLVAIVLKYDFAWMMFTIINASLGFLISFVLLCNKRVVRVLKKPICRWIRRVAPPRTTAEMSTVSASTTSASASTYKVGLTGLS